MNSYYDCSGHITAGSYTFPRGKWTLDIPLEITDADVLLDIMLGRAYTDSEPEPNIAVPDRGTLIARARTLIAAGAAL